MTPLISDNVAEDEYVEHHLGLQTSHENIMSLL